MSCNAGALHHLRSDELSYGSQAKILRCPESAVAEAVPVLHLPCLDGSCPLGERGPFGLSSCYTVTGLPWRSRLRVLLCTPHQQRFHLCVWLTYRRLATLAGWHVRISFKQSEYTHVQSCADTCCASGGLDQGCAGMAAVTSRPSALSVGRVANNAGILWDESHELMADHACIGVMPGLILRRCRPLVQSHIQQPRVGI